MQATSSLLADGVGHSGVSGWCLVIPSTVLGQGVGKVSGWLSDLWWVWCVGAGAA